MRYQAFVRAAATVLSTALFAGAAFAQSSAPSPRTMTDTAPLPASERGSLGAVIMMDEPVLAQREQMLQAMERSAVDTRTMGAGPSRILRSHDTRDAVREQRALDAAGKQKGTPK
ncbi:MAG TPA: hypothetical protein VHL79_06065 [Ramlibacter sp.]|jgi:hypothetical protein|nr:hypothetical protein [Ramlibacter sp.]